MSFERENECVIEREREFVCDPNEERDRERERERERGNQRMTRQ